MAVVGDDDAQSVAGAFDGDLGVVGVGVLGDVGECLGDDEVGDGLDAGRATGRDVDAQPHGEWRACRDPGQGCVEAAVVDDGWVQAADEVAQLGEGLGGLVVGLLDGMPGGFGYVGEVGAGHAQVHREGDQPLLRAVVEVAFDAAAFSVGRGDDVGAASGQCLDPLRQLLTAAGTEQRAGGDLVDASHAPGQPRSRGQHGKRQQGHGQVDASRPPAPELAGIRERESSSQPADRHQSAADASDDRCHEVVAELSPRGG